MKNQNCEKIKVVVEIVSDSDLKYEINKRGGIKMDRVVSHSLTYPFSYGFIPETLADDGDALDVVIISELDFKLKDVIGCRVVAVLKMRDEHGVDQKIIAVPLEEKSAYRKIKDLSDLSLPIREKIDLFFRHYKEADKKRWSQVFDFISKDQALKIINKAEKNVNSI
jgi:inorganic pyrophosphatase